MPAAAVAGTAASAVGEQLLGGVGDLFGSIFSGGPKPCEEYVARAAKQVQRVTEGDARRAWKAVGSSTARAILQFPPLSQFCETDNVSIACSSDLDESAWRSAGGFRLRGSATKVLRAVGVEVHSGCTKEQMELARVVLSKWSPSSADGGSSAPTLGGFDPVLAVALVAAAVGLTVLAT